MVFQKKKNINEESNNNKQEIEDKDEKKSYQ